MRHIKDAQKFIDNGDSAQAMAVIDNLLGLAPRNPDALRLKAKILDAWGRFDEALSVFKTLSQLGTITEEGLRDLENCSAEEKEAFVYSELSAEGRWYFAFPKAQVWISLYGFVGCGLFLLVSPSWLAQGVDGFKQLILGFSFFVLLPWLALMVVHCIGIKKILIGIHGIRVAKRFSEKNFTWQELQCAVIEYDNDVSTQNLTLSLYGKALDKEPALSFNISKDGCVVRARRHFVRNVINYVDTVCYVNRDLRKAGVAQEVAKSSVEVASEVVAEQRQASGQNDSSNAA